MHNITAPFAIHAREQGDAVALQFDDAHLTWTELEDAVRIIAAGLNGCVKPRARIALLLPHSPALALLFLAIARAGFEAQIGDADWPPGMVRDVVVRLQPDLIMASSPIARLLRADKQIACDVIAFDDVSFAAACDAVTLRASAPPPDPASDPAARDDRDAPFYVGFTSGSTGLPKAYRRTHRSWLASFAADAKEFAIQPDDIILAPGALSHSLFVYALAHGLYRGARVVMMRKFNPRHALALMGRERISVLYGVPTQLKMLIEACAAPCESVRQILSTGAKWFDSGNVALRNSFPHARFAEFYGASETSFIAVAHRHEAPPAGSVGRAFADVALTIRDAEGHVLPAGAEGFVFVESEMIFSGYAYGEEADLMRAGHAISVGDVGVCDAQGFLTLKGRAKRMIVTSGKNLYPEDVERVLMQAPGVAQAAVICEADEKRGERLVALILPREACALRARDLIRHARAHLPLWQVPRHYRLMRQWCWTQSGKSDFARLLAAHRGGPGEELP